MWRADWKEMILARTEGCWRGAGSLEHGHDFPQHTTRSYHTWCTNAHNHVSFPCSSLTIIEVRHLEPIFNTTFNKWYETSKGLKIASFIHLISKYTNQPDMSTKEMQCSDKLCLEHSINCDLNPSTMFLVKSFCLSIIDIFISKYSTYK